MLAAISLLVASYALSVQAASAGVTTRYWDCCKTSCAWNGKAVVTAPVTTCDKSNNPLSDVNAQSGCNSGAAYACGDNSPTIVSDTLAYGFAAVNLSGQTEADWCCSCYKLTFTSGPVVGKTMIVQASNTGGDVGGAQFDLMIPGGGVGAFPQGCQNQYGDISGWGQQYGGVSSRAQCSNLPAALQAGCQFRFDWFLGADNPNVSWEKVTCPKTLAAASGCVRTSEYVWPHLQSSQYRLLIIRPHRGYRGTTDDSAAVKAATTTKSTTTTTTTKPTTTTTTTTSKMVTSTVKPTTTTTTTTTTTPKTTTTTTKSTTTTSKPATTTQKTTTSTTTSSTAHQSPVSSAVCTSSDLAPHWGQCGGQNWIGATQCEPPFTCQYQNPWYSQCL
ncbi:hypothetical protein FRB90_007193 [Tulasnella sp. 427]|nr:hypothetical protein FRB90_007193 [Tulasnella sp. 427]